MSPALTDGKRGKEGKGGPFGTSGAGLGLSAKSRVGEAGGSQAVLGTKTQFSQVPELDLDLQRSVIFAL